MYLVREENHDALCVAKNLGKGVLWLIENKWLDGNTIGIDENDNEYQIKDIIKDADKTPYLIMCYLIQLEEKDGVRAVLEWLEGFGFYFNEIEVA